MTMRDYTTKQIGEARENSLSPATKEIQCSRTDAIESYDRAIEINPKYALAWNGKGLALDSMGRYEEAIKCFDKAIEANPNDAMAMLRTGFALVQMGCPEDLAHRIRSFAYSKEIGQDDRIFPINRKRAWQIVKLAGEKANIQKRVWPHLLRHSDAIERLRQTGNPKALQLHSRKMSSPLV
jgi:tetratricopeptide (TPR) repeat protein